MIKSLLLHLFLLFSLSLMAQLELKYPDHYKTIEDDDIEVGDTIVVSFRYSICVKYSWFTKDTANKKIFQFIKDNNQFYFDLHVFTDARGSEGFNLKLSKSRAKFVKDKMIDFGLDSSLFRNTYGHGESNPIIPEGEIRAIETEAEQEAAHQMNRRTYFVVVGRRED